MRELRGLIGVAWLVCCGAAGLLEAQVCSHGTLRSWTGTPLQLGKRIGGGGGSLLAADAQIRGLVARIQRGRGKSSGLGSGCIGGGALRWVTWRRRRAATGTVDCVTWP